MRTALCSRTRAFRQRICTAAAIAVLFAAMLSAAPAGATTKGLNQIITPDIQPAGLLSVSFQCQHPAIGNGEQMQLELGVTKNFEVALFRGFSPGQFLEAAEYGIVQKPSFLLSTGVIRPFTGDRLQPFIEAGFPRGKDTFTLGAIRADEKNEALLGWAHQASPILLLETDYQGGSDNFTTLGFTYSITPSLSLNPAVYVSNSTARHAFGYAVLTWNAPAWK